MGFFAALGRATPPQRLERGDRGQHGERVIADEPRRRSCSPLAGGAVTSTWNGNCVSAPEGTIRSCLPLMRSSDLAEQRLVKLVGAGMIERQRLAGMPVRVGV